MVTDMSDPMIDPVHSGTKSLSVAEYTDPICSWAWGSEPKFRLLRWRHGHRLEWRTVMGGLVGDATNGRPDWDPVLAAKPMQAYWRQTNRYTGQPYPVPMRRMARSTDPAGRAIKAAIRQGPDVAARVLRRLRESTFIFGVTPHSAEDFAAATLGVPGLDRDRFLSDLDHPDVAAAYTADRDETRRPNDHVRFLEGNYVGIGNLKHSEGHDRYAFPTLIVRGPSGEITVPGWMPYSAYVDALEEAQPGSTSNPRPDPTPEEAFAEWGVLTSTELEFLCGTGAADDHDVPPGTVAHNWGAGLVYFTPEEAAARNLPSLSAKSVQPLVDLLAVSEQVHGQIASVQPDEWSRSTPCDEWDVRALVNHIVGGIHMVTYGLTGREIGPEFYGDYLADDPVKAHRTAIDEMATVFRNDAGLLERSLTMPWGPCRGSYLAEMFMADDLVHAWDLGWALGRIVEPDPMIVERARVFAEHYVPSRRGPGMFSEAVALAHPGSPIEQLAAYVGRTITV